MQVEQHRVELNQLVLKERERLEQVSGLTAQQAKEELMRVMERDARVEAARLLKRIEDEAREHGLREAQRIVAMAIERSASDYVSETTVSVVMLPSDEMKGGSSAAKGATSGRSSWRPASI